MPIELGSLSIGIVVGGIIIGFANHFLSKSRNKEMGRIAVYNKAATDFREAFLPEATFLKHNANIGGLGSSNDLKEILRDGYLRHLKAFEIFKTYLTPKKRIAIEKKWEEYCNFAQYSDKANEVELKKLALKHIEAILKFTEHK